MLTISRIAGAMDVGRLGEAVSRPGIDPRIWAFKAVVRKVVVDPDNGVLCDILILGVNPIEETAKLAPMYAGDRFGMYLPVRPQDTVLVWAPNGCPDDGLEIIGRVWDGADKPPPEVADNPQDPLILVEPGQNIRIICSGGGDAIIEVRDNGKVKLGAETGLQPAALGTDLEARISALESSFILHIHPGGTIMGNTGAITPAPTLGTPTFQADKAEVK